MGETGRELMIEAVGLKKAYGETTALAGVDFSVPAGTILGLLGPNGAGKTTAVRILTTLALPDAGRGAVAGIDVVKHPGEVRRQIGVAAQDATLDPLLTGRQNLVLVGELSDMARAAARARAAELLEQFELTQAGRRRVSTYSGGLRRRLDLAASLAGHPSVIFLDEPTTGLDPQSRLTTWRAIAELAASGVTVFLTTQYLEEADRLAGQIAVLNGGLVVAAGTAAELKRRVAAQRLDLTCSTAGAYEQVSRLLADLVVHLDPAALTVGVATDGSAAQVRALLDEADPGRDLIASFAVRDA
ncbi:MAG TPA: ATP-binding cassette domain-containing protein, partial [Acidimicrobiales bacterium]|nr:ATP-binding cassette domain-containing protein [Acidimicrobiales bacterium]